MGVTKYRSVEQMPSPPPLRPLDPENLRIAFGLMALTNRLCSERHVPGVRKFTSYEEMVRAEDKR